MNKDLPIAALLLAGLLLSGCGSTDHAKQSLAEENLPPRYGPIKPIADLGHSDLFLAHVNPSSKYQILNLNNKLYVDDDVDRTFDVFATPPRAYDVTDLPPGWKDQGFAATGWESTNEGFGAILQKNRVAFAMFNLERQDGRVLDELVDVYSGELGKKPVAVDGRLSRYRFWAVDGQSLMVSSTQTQRFGTVVTLALGVQPIMDGLRMNPIHAREDIVQSEEIAKLTAAQAPGK